MASVLAGARTLEELESILAYETASDGERDFAAAFAAASGASLIQYFLTGGPVAALATVIPVIPGSDLKGANAFQRPSILFGCLVAFLITFCLNLL